MDLIDEDFLDERTLTYPGKVDPIEGRRVGPGLDGRVWQCLGGMYDTDLNKSFVTYQEIPFRG